MIKVLIVGSNPSTESRNKKIPFQGSKSWIRLNSWIEKLDLNEGIGTYDIINVSDKRTRHKVPLKKSEYQIKRLLIKAKNYDKVIALGNTAADALEMAGINYHKIDHPSPINRRLQDSDYVESMLDQCKSFLKE